MGVFIISVVRANWTAVNLGRTSIFKSPKTTLWDFVSCVGIIVVDLPRFNFCFFVGRCLSYDLYDVISKGSMVKRGLANPAVHGVMHRLSVVHVLRTIRIRVRVEFV